MKCSPNKVRSLLIGVRSFRLLGGLIRLFSEVHMVYSMDKQRDTIQQPGNLMGRQTNRQIDRLQTSRWTERLTDLVGQEMRHGNCVPPN